MFMLCYVNFTSFFIKRKEKHKAPGVILARTKVWAFQVAPVVKNLPANAGDIKDVGSIPGSEISPGEGNGNPFQYSCLANPMDRGAWQAIVYRVAKSWTQLK